MCAPAYTGMSRGMESVVPKAVRCLFRDRVRLVAVLLLALSGTGPFRKPEQV